jgi:AcrR family transcriptional regulator
MTLSSPREQILDAALKLMSEQGAAGSSMRQLAAAVDCNVATLYHYFPSKADLLRSVMEERRYDERLAVESPVIDASLPPRERLAALLRWLWRATLEEEAVWRLIVGESLRGEEVALSTAQSIVHALDDTLARWLTDLFPEMHANRAGVARLLRGQLFALVVEHLALGGDEHEQRAADMAALVFPEAATVASAPAAVGQMS